MKNQEFHGSSRMTRRRFARQSLAGAVVLTGLPAFGKNSAVDGTETSTERLAFSTNERQFPFDTGVLKGILRPEGRSIGLAPLVDAATDTTLNQRFGIFSHYRLLEPDCRYGHAGWDWQSEARRLPDGSVETTWSADNEHPFSMKAVYRWKKPDRLDLVTSVTAQKDLTRMEVFLASYFSQLDTSYVFAQDGTGKGAFVEAGSNEGVWQMFPRDEQAVELIRDGRWKLPPNPVDWAIRPTLANPLGMRRDRQTGLVALVMAPPEDCFAVATPHSGEGHRSTYLSLLGRDIKKGQTATARARLVVGRNLSFEEAIRIHEEYLLEI